MASLPSRTKSALLRFGLPYLRYRSEVRSLFNCTKEKTDDQEDLPILILWPERIHTTAPEIVLTAFDAVSGAELPVGSLVRPDAAGIVRVHLVVKAAPWVDVSRAALLLPFGERVVIPVGKAAADGVTRVDVTQRVRVPDGRDSWIAAEASGDRSLYPVVVPFEVPPLLLNDAVNSVGAAVGLKDDYGTLRPHQIAQTTPFAVTNPIFVDGDGDGSWGLPRQKHAKVGPRSLRQNQHRTAVESRVEESEGRAVDLRSMYRHWGTH